MVNNKPTGRLEVLVVKDTRQWLNKLSKSEGFIDTLCNFPAVIGSVEVELKDLDNKDVFYLDTDRYGRRTVTIPCGNYQATAKYGDQPSKNITVHPGYWKKNKLTFHIYEKAKEKKK